MTSVDQGRAAFARQAWGEAFVAFAGAAGRALDAVDQERLAVCAYLVGADERCATAWEAGASRCAARRAILLTRPGTPSGWRSVSCCAARWRKPGAGSAGPKRLIADAKLDCAASGYLLIPELLGALERGPGGGVRPGRARHRDR